MNTHISLTYSPLAGARGLIIFADGIFCCYAILRGPTLEDGFITLFDRFKLIDWMETNLRVSTLQANDYYHQMIRSSLEDAIGRGII